jgi:Fanconi anemia group M protein
LKTEIIKVDFPVELSKIRDLLNNIFLKKVDELKSRKLLFYPPTKTFLLDCQRNIMRAIASGNKNFNLFGGASACAIAIKIQHAIEMVETQGASQAYSYLQGLFEEAKKGKSKASVQVVKNPDFNRAYILLSELIQKKIEHPKIDKLIEVINKEYDVKKKARIIVFANYRDTAIKISKILNNLEIGGKKINAKIFVGQTMKDGVGLSQKEQQEIIADFSLGLIDILVCTSIGEEGLDIPEVDAVIFYEPIPSAIRRIQRAGRTARLKPGKLVILMTGKTRDEAYHYASIAKERKMHRILKDMHDKFNGKENKKDGEFKTAQQKRLDL